MLRRPTRIYGFGLGASVGAALCPAAAVAHGPPDWLFWPTAAWGLLALFALFAGTGSSLRARCRQGPGSKPMAVIVALLAAFLGVAALLARRRTPPPD